MIASKNAARAGSLLLMALGGPLLLAAGVALSGCSEVSNNPHPLGSEKTNTIFVPFLSTVAQISRPDQLVLQRRDPVHLPGLRAAVRLSLPEAPLRARRTRRARRSPIRVYLDKDGKELPDDAPGEDVAETRLDIKIKPGIRYRAASGVRQGRAGRVRLSQHEARGRRRTSTRSPTSRRRAPAS